MNLTTLYFNRCSVMKSLCYLAAGSVAAGRLGHLAETLRPTTVFGGRRDAITALAFSPDGKTVASGEKDGTIFLWDVATQKALRTLTGHQKKINSLEFSTNGRFLLSGSDDESAKLWDARTGEFQVTLHDPRQNGIQCVAISARWLDNRHGEQRVCKVMGSGVAHAPGRQHRVRYPENAPRSRNPIGRLPTPGRRRPRSA